MKHTLYLLYTYACCCAEITAFRTEEERKVAVITFAEVNGWEPDDADSLEDQYESACTFLDEGSHDATWDTDRQEIEL
jgi:hypothetical protein